MDGLPEDDLLGTALETRDSPLGDVLGGGGSVALPDVHADAGLPRELAGPDGSLLLVPLRTALTLSGVLAIGWSAASERAFLDTDVRLVEAYADQAALAMQVAQARDDRSRLAVFEDRDRIGRDLHDLVIQRLFAIGLTLEGAARLAVRPEAAQRISTAVDDIDTTIKDIRRTIFELSAPTESADLRAKVSQAVTDLTPALGFTPRLVMEGPVDSVVTDDVRPHLMAVLREALTNVARHAAATSAEVVLSAGDDVVLTVSDDGVGYQPGPRSSGVRNMADRAAALGGTLRRSPVGTAAAPRSSGGCPPAAEPVGQASVPLGCLLANTAAWVRRSSPSFASRLDT